MKLSFRSRLAGTAVLTMLALRATAMSAQVNHSGTRGVAVGVVSLATIPNQLLQVNIEHATLWIEGTLSDSIGWTVSRSVDGTAMRSDPPFVTTGSAQVKGAWAGLVRTSDRATLSIGIAEPGAPLMEVHLKIPASLKLLHVLTHGGGNVTVTDFHGELNVTSDSGHIAATNPTGTNVLEARNGGIDLVMPQTSLASASINLLSHNGSITVTLPEKPSILFDLNANCGEFKIDLPVSDLKPAGISDLPPTPDADCALRPSTLPRMEGVLHMRHTMRATLGTGTVTLQAMSLQGDIQIKRYQKP